MSEMDIKAENHFWRSANAKICKELKEKLNSGDEVQVDRESVFVAAAVITDFLRNIPDSVLSSEMHSLWMEAMDKETRAHKTEAVKSLVNQLPEANLILLRHLFGVLRHIEQNSVENQMNASNLALCIAPNMLWLPSPTGPEEESKSTKKVATLVQFLIENSAEIFGGDAASLFQRPEKEKLGRSTGSLLAQHNDSSDEMEFAASYLEASGPRYALETEGSLFSPPGGFQLSREQEDWDLFSEITACYQSKAREDASADSYDLLEEEASFCSTGSICTLDPARDRCSSEPSVCLSSQLPTQSHEPVARQSSCDAALVHGQGGCARRLRQLQLESQKLLDEGPGPGPGRARQAFWWRSPAPGSGSAKGLRLQKSSLSNRSSVSSLSSPTTSPSASSLSSLDSAFSYCSESSALSPTDAPSLPFLFGTSARLQAWSSKGAKRPLKEGQKPLTSPLPPSPCSWELRVEKGRADLESGASQGPARSFMPTSVSESLRSECSWGEGEGEGRQAEALPEGLVPHRGPGASSPRPPVSNQESIPVMTQQAHREKTVKHIEIRGPEAAPHSQERLKRTKITVYMAPKERSLLGPEEEAVTASPCSDGSSNPDVPKNVHTVRVHIPQTVFYGQHTPLVLQSISRRYHQESVSPVGTPPRDPPREEPVQQAAGPKTHGGERGSRTFSHTFRLPLPTSIRNTIREYFSHDSPKSCCSLDDADAVEGELVRSRAEWRGKQPCAGSAAKEQSNLMLAEETFV
ncbi:UNVERIFIED_CONTAM: hypothetical protein K2H54_053830 [Gekko kuhli]